MILVKRLFDFTLVVLGLAILLPIALIIGWYVRKNLGYPILFRQKRPGLKGEVFEMLKM